MGFFRKKINEEEMETVKRLLKEVGECSYTANHTADADAFFENYNGMERRLRELSDYEKFGVFKGGTPSKDLTRIENNFQNDLNLFIQRSWICLKEEIGASDEESAAKKREEYFRSLEKYEEEMNFYNKSLVKDMRDGKER